MQGDQNQKEFMMEDDQMNRTERAHQNWQKIRDIIKKKTIKKKIYLYHLFPVEEERVEKLTKMVNMIQQFIIITNGPNPDFHYLTKQNHDEIDTTGTWVWEAENLLTYFLLKNEQYGKVESVLELGAGTSGLAALLFSLKYKPQKIVITDGKEDNIEFLEMNIQENGQSECCRSQKYLWGSKEIEEKFSLILAADCLFFENYHEELIQTFINNLEENGRILLVNPRRGKSMSNFLSKLKMNNFSYQILDFADQYFQNNLKIALKSTHFDKSKDFYYFIEARKEKVKIEEPL